MTNKRIATVEVFPTGPKAGLGIVAGGIDAETTNGSTPDFPTCESVLNIHQSTIAATDLFDPATTAFTATGALLETRGGYAEGILVNGPNSGDLAVFGGECATGTLSSSPNPGPNCSSNHYYELYSQLSGTWTAGTATQPATVANAPAYAVLP
jgi:hypothetical protein